MGARLPVVTLSGEVAAAVGLGLLAFDTLSIAAGDADLEAALAEAASALRVGGAPGADPSATRAMYRRFRIDPTRTRPSSEALLRRLRKGEAFPRVNALVDVCNWCSAEFQLPYGLYDLDRIAGDVHLRVGRFGETYAGIRKDPVHVEGRPVLVDRHGPFGNPTSDSARTMVTSVTTSALVVVYAPRDQAEPRLRPVLDVTAARILAHVRGRERHRSVVLV